MRTDLVLAHAWNNTAFYRRGDQRGTLQEVTPRKTREALKVLDRGRPVVTYNLGEVMFNGIPAFPSAPPRVYYQRLAILGYDPPPGYAGILQSPTPLGANRISAHEERFEPNLSYQIGTQLDGLNHIGVGPVFYGGHRGPDIAQTWGTSRLGADQAGPIVTRGMLLDVLGLKLAQGATDVLEVAPNGTPHLAATYRITLEDLESAMRRARVKTIERGDVVLIRTGWNQLLDPHDPTSAHAPDDPTHPGHPAHHKYLSSEPGIYLREARWLASHRPAILGADNWALEVAGNPVAGDNVFPVHQELITHHGIRIGEAIVTDRLADDRVFEFVYIVTPQLAAGATAGNTPPCALGQPR
jgi:kynurenine formamidase